ncbi:uncharacterized protein EI90DRAFT_2238277 [Cantharellus anzutake]|uniref:uncharacterized protein n=1 Tax=Cantharellus anzutake TaxID=1750568 RepID=UPI001903476B|nr:uncharacterized protein EI90DRAFT_2238277 [Cantharellus anzutake]KAF8324659.1 hypothetical protein EI90DRAFT_2238277 [Cantharellus anzutake]
MPNLRSGRHGAVPLDALAPETLMEEEPLHIGGSSVEVTEPAFGDSPENLTPPQQHPHGSREIQVPLPNQSALKRSNLEIGPSVGEPSSKRAPTTLAVHPNVLDEATHITLDALVVEFMLKFAEHLSRNPFRLLLLDRIVLQSDGVLDSKSLPPLDDLIAQHPELGDRLDEAWEAQSFKEIRNLEILLPTAQPAGPPDPEAILDSQSSEDAAVKSWSSKYRGDAANILYHPLAWGNREWSTSSPSSTL